MNGVSRDVFAYDGFHRMIGAPFLKTGTPNVVQFDAQYGYDDGGRRLFERRVDLANVGDLYAYDDLGRVVQVLQGVTDPIAELQSPGSQAYATKVDYAFDKSGARTSVARTPYGGQAATTTYGGNALHQYPTIGATNRTYDANGNLTSDGTFAFEYDYKNQPVNVIRLSDSAAIASYEYDSSGRRTKKTVGATITRFYYSGPNLIEVRDGSGTVLSEIVHGNGADDPVAIHQRDIGDYDGDTNVTGYLWFGVHQDARQSVRLLTDAAGAIVETYDYDEYGALTIRNAARQPINASQVGNVLTFTGREWDAETGLYYYRARYYDPAHGAFLQRDPLGARDAFCLYAYCAK